MVDLRHIELFVQLYHLESKSFPTLEFQSWQVWYAGLLTSCHPKNIIGCPRYPGAKLFCPSHKDHVSPVVHHKQIKADNLAQLNKDKKGQQHDTDMDGVFLIEEILEKKASRYHIKWKGYTVTTWEPASSVPKFIKDFYQRTGQSKLPKPRILDSRVCGRHCIYLHYNSLMSNPRYCDWTSPGVGWGQCPTWVDCWPWNWGRGSWRWSRGSQFWL